MSWYEEGIIDIAREDYSVPDACENCGEREFSLRVIAKNNGFVMVKCRCRACGWEKSLPKTKNYYDRTSTAFNRWAHQVKTRDGRCVICGSVDDLEAHHIIPVSHSNRYVLRTSNGITLCKNCHWLVHNKEKET